MLSPFDLSINLFWQRMILNHILNLDAVVLNNDVMLWFITFLIVILFAQLFNDPLVPIFLYILWSNSWVCGCNFLCPTIDMCYAYYFNFVCIILCHSVLSWAALLIKITRRESNSLILTIEQDVGDFDWIWFLWI